LSAGASSTNDQGVTSSDIDTALNIWRGVRETRPMEPDGWLAAARLLRDIGRFDEAEALLTDARMRFLAQPAPFVDWALLAHHRRDWAEALRRWDAARTRFPDQAVAYVLAAVALRETGRLSDAESLLGEARGRFPNDPGAAIEYAWIAHFRRDWEESVRRWEHARARFPAHAASYVFAGVALRELGRFDESLAMLTDARERFPDDVGAAIEYAWILHYRREWDAAIQGWEYARTRFPDRAGPYVFGGVALRERGMLDEAGILLADARERFPDDPGAATEYAWVAHYRHDWGEAARRWEYARTRFPNNAGPYVFGAVTLREAGRMDEAEALLADARKRFPTDPGAATEYAGLANARRDWPEALRRWEEVRAILPNSEAGYSGGAQALRALNREAEAEALLREAVVRLPREIRPRIELARLAEIRGDWTAAEQSWRDLTAAFPNAPDGPIGEATIQRRHGRLDDAEAVIEVAMARMPNQASLAEEHGLNAMAREDWPLALRRLDDAQARFPTSNAIRRRLYEVQLRVADSGGVPAPMPAGRTEGTDADRELVMNFESLGGGGHGCEFGIFQRSVGAEPLGLLRWADVYQDQLATALDLEFAGVGEPDFTRIFVPPTDGRPMYWTTDTRYHMAMGSFVYVDEVAQERMARLVHQRTRFLRGKLIDDLTTGTKIFVYKNMKRNLTDAELTRLHGAVRRYGDNTLFYIRYQDADHPNGMVEYRGPGLMVGYIDHFSHTPDTDVLITPAHAQFLVLCRNALELWRARQSAE
jgi:tetratricopeptide (TPR) repeat protein